MTAWLHSSGRCDGRWTTTDGPAERPNDDHQCSLAEDHLTPHHCSCGRVTPGGGPEGPQYDLWLGWMEPEFMVRDLPKEKAARILADRGFTVSEYRERLERWEKKRPTCYGVSPPSILMFAQDSTDSDGWRIWWNRD